VNLLLQSGADPLITDAQGYNALHLATFDGNVFMLTLLLHQNIPIDGPDLQGHTCLMWAAYNGFPACVDLFLRWGANVNATDENGFTALHWACVNGSQPCIQKLIEYGSDRFAKTADGKTPSSISIEMKSTRMWERALIDCGYDENGSAINLPFPSTPFIRQREFLKRFFFLYPFAVVFIAIYILSNVAIYAAIPFAVACAYSMHWGAMKLLQWAPSGMRHTRQTVSILQPRLIKFNNIISPIFQASLLDLASGLALDGSQKSCRV
jgi:palmitoyltransferase